MAKLTKEEAEQLKALTAKAKAPDAPTVGRSVSVTVDLGDEAQVERAIRLGLLDAGDLDDGDGDGDGDGGGDDDEPPTRKGYFGDD